VRLDRQELPATGAGSPPHKPPEMITACANATLHGGIAGEATRRSPRSRHRCRRTADATSLYQSPKPCRPPPTDQLAADTARAIACGSAHHEQGQGKSGSAGQDLTGRVSVRESSGYGYG
jgi:hypothetical protein